MKHAFSLVELSIVLVILGLLVGGILAGQSLIRAAELRSVSTDFARYKTALYGFRDKYFSLPGDMSNATAFWGKDNVGCASHTGTITVPGTCNGNGDGYVTYTPGGEAVRIWQHLANAGLIEGSYTGSGVMDLPGQNIPASKITGAGYNIFLSTTLGYVSVSTSDANRLIFGRASSGSAGAQGAILLPEEAWNIDSKIDDGNGYQGALRAWTGAGNSGGCLNGSAYSLNNSGIACFINISM